MANLSILIESYILCVKYIVSAGLLLTTVPCIVPRLVEL